MLILLRQHESQSQGAFRPRKAVCSSFEITDFYDLEGIGHALGTVAEVIRT